MPVEPAGGGPRKKIEPSEKEQIIELARQGVANVTIARDLNIHGHTVNGIIFNARKRGALPPLPPKERPDMSSLPPMPPPVQMQPPPPFMAPPVASAPPPAASPQMAPPPVEHHRPMYTQPVPPPSSDDFVGGRPVMGGSGGFTAAHQGVKYTVERTVPPDGLLGTHHGSFTNEDLGQIYGEGTYRVTRHEPGRAVPMEFNQKIGPSYGPPRSPNSAPSQQRQPFAGGRTPFFARPSWADQSHQTEDPQGLAAQRPYPFYPRAEQAPAPDRSLVDFARHSAQAGEGAISKAIEMMGTIHAESLRQVESARRTGPESQVTKILETQQDLQNKRWEEERRRDEDKRKADEEKHDRQQREDRERYERERKLEQERHERDRQAEKERYDREQQAQKDAHEREVQRLRAETDARLLQLKAESEERARREKEDREERERRAAEERKFFLELEEKKLQLVRQEADAAQKRMELELQKTREDMKSLQDAAQSEMRETREATSRHIEDAQSRMSEQLERDRTALEREHKLREKALDKEHELNREIIQYQKESVEKQGGDQLVNLLQSVVKEASKGFGEVVNLQKIKSMHPDAQTAFVAKGGNMEGEQGAQGPQAAARQAPPPPQQPPPQQQAYEQTPPQNGNGQHQEAAAQQQAQAAAAQPNGNYMESLIVQQIQTPLGQEMMQEWALHVDSCTEDAIDSTSFVATYLEMMKDDFHPEKRQACVALAAFMKVRKWDRMYRIIRPYLAPEVQEVLDRPIAALFYEQFRGLVILQIKAFFEQFGAAQGMPVGGQNGAAAPAPGQNGAPVPTMQQPAAQAPVEPRAGTNGESTAPPAPPVPTRESLRGQQ